MSNDKDKFQTWCENLSAEQVLHIIEQRFNAADIDMALFDEWEETQRGEKEW